MSIWGSYHQGHEATIAFYDDETNEAACFEVEKITGKRYCREFNIDKIDIRVIKYHVIKHFDTKKYFVDNLVVANPQRPVHSGAYSIGRDIFEKRYRSFVPRCDHHMGHAAFGFYTSPFNKAVIITTDGGGDGLTFTVNVVHDRTNKINRVFKSNWINLGGLYQTMAAYCSEVTTSRVFNTFAGKAMALSAMGHVNENVYEKMRTFFNSRPDWRAGLLSWPTRLLAMTQSPICNDLTKAIGGTIVSGQQSYDLMATTQKLLQDIFEEQTREYIEEYPDYPIIISGGVALNVINNEYVKQMYPQRKVFVPVAPGDNGLPLGYIFYESRPKQQVDVTFSGSSIIDYDVPTGGIDSLVEGWFEADTKTRDMYTVLPPTNYYGQDLFSDPISLTEVAEMLADGKIIGVLHGRHELGPRALGARSILCDPSYKDMKDRINKKIKGREWYRPFAPICKLEHASKYFDSHDFEFMQFMSFAPLVREEYREQLPSITHFDGTARLQTVDEKNNKYLYDILDAFEQVCGRQVLLNTSFNNKGKAILNEVREAAIILASTDLDAVIFEDRILRLN